MMKDIAQGEGDLTRRLEINSPDEMVELARWFNTFVEKIQILQQRLKDFDAAKSDELRRPFDEIARKAINDRLSEVGKKLKRLDS